MSWAMSSVIGIIAAIILVIVPVVKAFIGHDVQGDLDNAGEW